MRVLKNQANIKLVMLLGVVSVFLGRAWQFLFWDAPYRTLFWDEGLLKPLVESLFKITWYEYVTSSATDNFINGLVFSTGVIYLLSAVSCLVYYFKRNKIAKILIFLGGFNLVLLSFLLMKDKYYQFGQFFEHSIQFSLPFIFVFYVKGELKNINFWLKFLIGIVFVSHGLYAIGYYPVPGNFQDMVIRVFNFSEGNAKLFLKFAGRLDFIVALAVFIPKVSRFALIYAVLWGLLTAFARIVANLQMDFLLQTIHQELHGTLFRLSHGLVPLLVILLERKTRDWRLSNR